MSKIDFGLTLWIEREMAEIQHVGTWVSMPALVLIWVQQQDQIHYLFFNFPFGKTDVVGATGRSENPVGSLEVPLSFFGFFTILLLRCSPLGMSFSWLKWQSM